MYVHTMQVKTNGIQDNLDASPISLNKKNGILQSLIPLVEFKEDDIQMEFGIGRN